MCALKPNSTQFKSLEFKPQIKSCSHTHTNLMDDWNFVCVCVYVDVDGGQRAKFGAFCVTSHELNSIRLMPTKRRALL